MNKNYLVFYSKRLKRIERKAQAYLVEKKSDEPVNPSIPLDLAKQTMLNQPRFLFVGDAGGDSLLGILGTKGEKNDFTF